MALVSSGQLTLTDLNDTKQLILYLNANYKTQIYDPTAGTYSPSFTSTNLTIEPELYIAGGNGANMLPSTSVKSITWYEGAQTATPLAETASGTTGAGYSYTLPTGAVGTTKKILTIKSNLSGSQRYTCVIVYTDPDTKFDIPIKADIEIARIQNGAKGDVGTNAITAFLTNSAVTLPASNNGTVSVFTGSSTDIYVYDGTNALQFTTGTAGTGQFSISASISPASGVTLASPTATGTGNTGSTPYKASYGNITAMAQAQDVVVVTFTITGKSKAGTSFTTTVIQTFNKSKQALDGNSPTSYWLTTDYAVITKAKNTGTISPATVKATMNSQTGTNAPVNNVSMKWVVDTSTDGTTFTNNVASPSTGTSVSQATNVSNLKAIRFRMYLSTVTPSTTNFVDEEIVWVIAEGNDGNDSYFLNVWTPRGDAIRNSSGSLDIQADLYKGSSLSGDTITYKWYIQDASATTSSGGDTDGGAGWRLINAGNASTYGATNYTSKTITITEKGINGVTGWKSVAKVGSTVYADVIILRDFQDPISVNILGANIFKNGEGSVTLKAQLLQAGAIIPNTGYTFAWSLYSTTGSLIKTLTGTSDTITVQATDVDGVANVVCDVSK